ncbi:MAG TPA: YggT family protein [Dermatophilaceae bacterium]|nr:YggT family protein [Dermatophilaceae bacterium]
MRAILNVLYIIVYVYFIALMARLVIDWIQMFARQWRPKGPVLVLLEGVYTVTDPPLKALRRVIPPLRLGSIALDLSFLVLLFGVSLLLRVLA